jgi:hypothetical protein
LTHPCSPHLSPDNDRPAPSIAHLVSSLNILRQNQQHENRNEEAEQPGPSSSDQSGQPEVRAAIDGKQDPVTALQQLEQESETVDCSMHSSDSDVQLVWIEVKREQI